VLRVEVYCSDCRKNVIPDVRFGEPQPLVSGELSIKCLGWFCPICGQDFHYERIGMPCTFPS